MVPFRIGEVVWYPNGKGRSTGIVEEVIISMGSFEYTVDGCSWYKHKDLLLCSAATEGTVEHVLRRWKENHENYDEEV